MSTHVETSASAKLYERALQVLPGGISRNTVWREPYPAYAAYGSGCRVVDIEGVSRFDFANNMASLIHGHAFHPIVEAVTEQVVRGTAFTLATEVEIRCAEHLCLRNPSFEKVRFVNSGTEAVMVMLKAARAITGRPKIAKVEGAYHGGYDYVEVSQASGPATWGDKHRPQNVPLVHGTPASAVNDVVIIPFNDVENAIAILDEQADSLACVLIDPMPHRIGLVPADAEYVQALEQWAQRHSALFVFDEVITFRSEYGGLQSRYNISPDLTALGKMIGGGFPIGAVAGRADVMEVFDPRSPQLRYPLAGTFSANPVSMTAGLVAMEHFDPQAVARLNTLTDRARQGIDNAIQSTGAQACVTGAGSMFRMHMKSEPPRNYREAFTTPDEKRRLAHLLDHLFNAGFIMVNTGSAALSTPMTEAEVDALVNAIEAGLAMTEINGS